MVAFVCIGPLAGISITISECMILILIGAADAGVGEAKNWPGTGLAVIPIVNKRAFRRIKGWTNFVSHLCVSGGCDSTHDEK